ncbi:Dot/Icm T4SS effector PI phosphatase SidF [Legionella pneumophila]|uniref:Dot/Icm T4SS effector PI phosphatase SidF n=1 Tax=Legionella pneumophila TaxID=446 RepID=UPI000875B15C|nr:Dot/Icm T4SS effector PI phosphatase SidF [Legionella pneumophila]AOW58991.1 inhibitor of growth protein SidF [Legionella pneumophila subsp. pneumophila]AOW60821.1 inhibitor of growth protein SidF [Legionella pneumophila subsp. pneumophila]AOW66219.1 inhibitor of growth protein SidF [Legionella pneumophila subsp. pneumophila]
MPRITENIETYVTHLLSDLEPVPSQNQHLAYGYPGERQVFKDPILDGKQVVVVNSQYDKHGRPVTGQPDVIQEANNYIDNLVAAAKSLIDKDKKGEKDLRKNAIDEMAKTFKKSISETIPSDKAKADLFSSKKSSANKDFLEQLAKVEGSLQQFTQAVAKASGHKLKALDKEGHNIRSHNRDTLIHRFKAPNSKEGEEQFIMYIPCGRYTKRQQRLMGKDESEVNRDHDTTSHKRSDLVLGNSSMARMIVGTRHSDGTVTIHHDSFSGPGARMPYSDFKGADDYKKLAIKAVTLINQEEVIQTLAQRQIDRMTNENLWNKIPEEYRPDELPPDAEKARAQLIKLYVEHNPLSVTECYTQVVTAGQRVAAENQKEQFEYVRQMMDAFDGSKAKITIQTGSNTEVETEVGYQARMSSWGVNWFRQVGALNPLSDNSVTKNQNARFVNQMTDDVISNLDKVAQKLGDYDKAGALHALLKGPDVSDLNQQITGKENALKEVKETYREALFSYFEEYQKGEGKWDQAKLDQLKNQVDGYEKSIKKQESAIYELHNQIDALRKAYHTEHKGQINKALQELKEQISPVIQNKETDPETKSRLQHFYNSCAYLMQAQELYYENTWHHGKNNFKLQTLMASLSCELDYANTKGCKSNNDRGQRLAQKIVGNALWTAMSEDGLFTGEFLDHRRTHGKEVSKVEQLDRELTTIQALHHTANTGVSGGKFEIQDKANFADNGLFGKIANFAKVKEMGPENAFTKNMGTKIKAGLGLGLLAAAGLVALTLLFPPAGLAVAALGIGVAAGAAIVAGVTFAATYLFGTAIDAINNKIEEGKIKSIVREGMKAASENSPQHKTEQKDHLTVNAKLHQQLGVTRESVLERQSTPKQEFEKPKDMTSKVDLATEVEDDKRSESTPTPVNF